MKTIKVEKLAITFEEKAFVTEKETFPRAEKTNRGEPFWDTHPAKPLLEAAIRAGTNLKPELLRATREEFKAFKLKTFTKHVHQERSRQLASVAWQHRRNKKGQKQREKEERALRLEACATFQQTPHENEAASE